MRVDSPPDRFVLPTHLRQFSNWVVWGTTLRGVDYFKMEYGGNSMDGVGLCAGGTVPLNPILNFFGGCGVSSYRQRASRSCEVDGGAGGPDR